MLSRPRSSALRSWCGAASGFLLALGLTPGCGATPPAAEGPGRPRAELIARLCAELPSRAYDCTVAWPSSVPPLRRDLVMSASETRTLLGPAVRAVASCVDSPGRLRPGRVSVFALDLARPTRAQAERALPIEVRWEDAPCADLACRLPAAHLAGDLVVVAAAEFAPDTDARDLASTACRAVEAGATEARVRLESGARRLRSVSVEEDGVVIRERALDPRQPAVVARRAWQELELLREDERLEHEAAVREAAGAALRPIDTLDLDSEPLVDRQIAIRERRLSREPTPEALADLAELFYRGAIAHPARSEWRALAVVRAIEAGDGTLARRAFDALRASDPDLDTLGPLSLGVALAERRADEVAARLAPYAEGLPVDARASLTGSLLTGSAALPALGRSEAVIVLTRALVALARARGASLLAVRASAQLPLRGVAPTLEALEDASACSGERWLVVCADPSSGHPEGADAEGATMAVLDGATVRVREGACEAFAAEPTASPRAEGRLLGVEGRVRLVSVCGPLSLGFEGSVVGTELRVERATGSLARADLDQLAARLARPLATLVARVFPVPGVTLPVDPEDRDEALALALRVPHARCARDPIGILCTTDAPTPEALIEVARVLYASFSSD